MKNDVQKNILFLTLAGLVLIMSNVAILMGTRNGQIAPIDNLVLWSAFAVLSVSSLIWAVSMLGLQPMIVAISYTVGGFIAFQGVRLIPEANVAEIATAGAICGAFGALVIGNATTKVRLAFFTKRQVPFVFIIIALLLVDSLLNSRVSNAGWNVIANAVVFPFLFSGVVVGLAWVVFARVLAEPVLIEKAVKPVGEEKTVTNTVAVDNEKAAQLMFTVPESAALAESMESAVLAHDPEPMAEDFTKEPVSAVVSPEMDPMEEDAFPDNFFPLEIDKGEEALLLKENPELMGVAAMVAESAPELAGEADPVAEDIISLPEKTPILDSDPEPVDESGKPSLEVGKENPNDWLSSHLDLLSKLNNKKQTGVSHG